MDENTQQPPTDEIIKELNEGTEDKSEFFEDEETIDENNPDFDPPPPSEKPDIETPQVEEVFDPEAPKRTPRSAIHKSGKMFAPMLVNVIDTVAPMLIDAFAKTGNPDQFEAEEDDKKEMSNALADWIGTSNIEMSPSMTFLFTVVLAYSRPCMLAYQLKQERKKVSEQKHQLDESEKQRLDAIRQKAEAEKRTEQAVNDLEKLRAENAELQKKTEKTKLDAKKLKKEADKTTKMY
jgi:hypothetical protein